MTVALTILNNLWSAVLLPVFIAATMLGILASFAAALGGVAAILTVVFVVLRLVGILEWSWLWVLSPAWIMFACYMLIGIAPLIMRHSAPEFGRVASDHPVIVWTERHLNWTLVLGYSVSFVWALVLSGILDIVLSLLGVTEAFSWIVSSIGFWVLLFALVVMLGIWYLNRKHRSLAHLLWWVPLGAFPYIFPVPFFAGIPIIGVVGIGVLLCLSDKRSAQPCVPQDTEVESIDDVDSILINCGACGRQYRVSRGQGIVISECPNCGRVARIDA